MLCVLWSTGSLLVTIRNHELFDLVFCIDAILCFFCVVVFVSRFSFVYFEVNLLYCPFWDLHQRSTISSYCCQLRLGCFFDRIWFIKWLQTSSGIGRPSKYCWNINYFISKPSNSNIYNVNLLWYFLIRNNIQLSNKYTISSNQNRLYNLWVGVLNKKLWNAWRNFNYCD